MKDQDIILFEKYHKGEMSQIETTDFEKLLSENKTLQEDFIVFKEMQNYLHLKLKHNNALKALDSVHQQKTRQQSPEFKKKKKKFVLFAILLIAIIAGLLYLSEKLNFGQQANFHAHYVAPAWPSTRGDDQGWKSSFQGLLSQDTLSTIQELQEIKNIDSETKNYWLAELYLSIQKPDSSLTYIQKIKNADRLRDRLIYLKALNFFLKKDKDSINQIIESLPDDIENYYLIKIKNLQ